MSSELMRIPARSRRQAMDWSLVLISQGIEATIANPQEEGGWALLVPPHDYSSALSAIQQYRIENRGWPWQHEVFHGGILFDWGVAAWIVLLALFFWLDGHSDMQQAGLMDAGAVKHGQWWRIFTAVWLHADLSHLASNAALGFVFLGLAMGRFGTGSGLLAAYLAGAGGNVFSLLIKPAGPASLGASGMVMGALGLLALQSLSLWRKNPLAARYILVGLLGGIMLFVLLGLSPGTDIMAHLGGMITGVLLGGFLARLPNLARNTGINFAGGLAFSLLVVLPWYLALR